MRASVQSDVRLTRAKLRKFAPEVLKELDKANRKASKPVIDKAKRAVPPNELQLTNWAKGGRYQWDSGKVKRGIKVKQDKRRRGYRYSALLAFYNDTAAGAIFELAGTAQPGSLFNRELTVRFGAAPRLLWRVLDNQEFRKIQAEILNNYYEYEKKVNNIMKAQGTYSKNQFRS
jgi:hypothetical protein